MMRRTRGRREICGKGPEGDPDEVGLITKLYPFINSTMPITATMLYLHKILPALLLPVGLCLVLLGAALIWRKKFLVAAAFGILLLASNPLVSSFLLSRLENRFPKIEIPDCPGADAVVVLSGILGGKRSAQGIPELNWGEAYDRFDAGIRLFQAGKAPYLVLTNPRVPWEEANDFSEGRQLVEAAVERGIPKKRIILLGPVGNTADEAHLVLEEASARGWQRIILVTTAWHLPRAFRLFSPQGVPTGPNIQIVPYPADFFTSGEIARLSFLHFLPSARSLWMTEIFLREKLGMLYYSSSFPWVRRQPDRAAR